MSNAYHAHLGSTPSLPSRNAPSSYFLENFGSAIIPWEGHDLFWTIYLLEVAKRTHQTEAESLVMFPNEYYPFIR